MSAKRIVGSGALLASLSVLAVVQPTEFKYGVELTLANALASESVADVPALVRISEASLPGFRYADVTSARNFVFTDADGNELPYEIDTFNPAGESLVWVKLPATDAGTRVKLYWGSDGQSTLPATDVWSGYVGVWHLSEQGGPNAVVTLKDSTANGYDGESVSGATCQAADGKLGSGWQIASPTAKGDTTGGILMKTMKDVALGTQFTISAWAYHKPGLTYYWDHLFFRKNAASDAAGYSCEINNGTSTQLNVRGSGGSQGTVKLPSTAGVWAHLAISMDGKTVNSFCDGGAVKSTATAGAAATDNGLAVAFGCDTDTNDVSWHGSFDELRIRKGAYDETYLTAEYAAMNVGETDIFTFGAVTETDTSAPKFGAATMQVNADGSVVVSVVIDENVPVTDSVQAVVGEQTVTLTTTDASLPQTYTGTLAPLTPGTYTLAISCQSTGGSTISAKETAFYTGALTLEKTADADEASLAAGSFTISRADAGPALTVFYTVGGSAVAGETYESLTGSVVIPAGETSVVIPVKPIYAADVSEDVTVTVTLAAGPYYLAEEASSATMTIVNVGDTAFVRYVAPTGDDANSGETPAVPMKTVHAAVASLREASEVQHCTVHVADGVYAITTTTGSLYITNSISVVGNLSSPSSVVFTNSTFAQIGLVRMNHAQAELSGVTLVRGRGYQQDPGANLKITGEGGTVSNCVVTAGFAENYHSKGANVYLNSDAALVTHCTITKGYADSTGGGYKGVAVHIEKGRMEHSLIAENEDRTDGKSATVAIVYLTAGSLVNCTIANNAGKQCGGVYVNGAQSVVKNCVIAGNAASVTGGDSVAYKLNTGNKVTARVFDHCVMETSAPVNETCAAATSDQVLSNAASGDYTLAAGSPAIDFGATLDNPPAVDLTATAARVQGAAIDAGCYESDPTRLALAFESDVTQAILPATITFTAVATGLAEDEQATYHWDFDGDGVTDETTTEPTVSHVYETGGVKTVSVTMVGNGRELTVKKEDYLKLAPRVLYVDAASTTPAVPYGSWETASQTIAAAVSAAIDGCEIIVRAGAYDISSNILVEKAITVHSETERPDDVVVRGNEKCRILNVNNASAKVSGLTLANGVVDGAGGSGVLFGVSGGTVSNCVIRNSRVHNWAGNGVIYFNGPGLLTHAVVSNNTTTSYCNGTKYVLIVGSGGRLENSLITGNYSSGGFGTVVKDRLEEQAALMSIGDKSSLVNCTVVGNTVNYRGLLSVSKTAIVQNNVFAGNTYVAAGVEVVDKSPDVGFNFGASASVSGQPVYKNCAFDETCGFEAAPNDTCVLGTAADLFTDFAAGDVTPLRGGLLVNAGVELANAPAVDLLGKTRIVKKIDIGCFEQQGSAGYVLSIR